MKKLSPDLVQKTVDNNLIIWQMFYIIFVLQCISIFQTADKWTFDVQKNDFKKKVCIMLCLKKGNVIMQYYGNRADLQTALNQEQVIISGPDLITMYMASPMVIRSVSHTTHMHGNEPFEIDTFAMLSNYSPESFSFTHIHQTISIL